MSNRLIILLTTILTLSGCNPTQITKEGSKTASISSIGDVTTDISTPDRAVKSYWAVRKAANEDSSGRTAKAVAQTKSLEINKQYSKVMSGQTLDWHISPREFAEEIYDREILEVKQETESRAIVFSKIKNVTPIPPGAIATKDDLKRREDGEKFKYVLEKTAAGWKVDQVYKYEDYKNGWIAVYDNSREKYIPMFVNYD